MVDVVVKTSPAVDRVVEGAKSLPELVAALKIVDPSMAAKVSGAASAAGATPLGTFLAGAVGFAVTRWGLGWDQDTQAMVVGACVLGGGYVAHWAKVWLANRAAMKPGAPA